MNIKKHILFLSLVILGLFFSIFNFASALHNPILNDKQVDWLEQNINDIRFAPEKDYPPMIWEQYGDIFGVSKDYFDFMQQMIGFRFEYADPKSLSDILTGVQASGEKVIISSLAITPQRSEYLLFTRPYFSSPTVFISKKSKKMTANEIMGKNLTVSVGDNYGVHEYLEERYPEMDLMPVPNNYQVLQSVVNDKADIAAIDVVSMMYLIKENNIKGIYKIGDIGYNYDFSFAVPKDMPILRNILDDAIAALPHSFRESVLEKWEVDYFGVQKLVASPDVEYLEKNSIETKTVIILMLSVIMVILFGEFLMHKFVFRKHLKEDSGAQEQ